MARVLTDAEQKIVDLGIEILRDAISTPGAVMENPDYVKNYLRLKLPLRERECFGVLLLDSQNRLLADVELFQGTIAQTSVHPREVVKTVLEHNASRTIFYHNHPSQDQDASSADRAITKRLQAALQLIDVKCLDHLISGGLGVMSFAESGYLDADPVRQEEPAPVTTDASSLAPQ